MGCVPPAAAGFFPLDEELELLPGQLTPRLHEQLVRLGTWVPFEKAAALFRDFTGVSVNEDYARRQTEDAGAVYVGVQTAEVERLEQETPPPPSGPAQLCLSADGAMVPLVGGEWGEVKTLMLGEVASPVVDAQRGEAVVHLRAISYFSRLTDNHTFERLALVETHRRGVETARQVGAVVDGAEWLQGFVNFHRPDALRILDFPHAAGYVAKIDQAVYGEGTPESQSWLTTHLHQLKHEGPHDLLADLRALTLAQPESSPGRVAWAYLDKREAQLHYPSFQAAGWPIGSGAVESGNKLVVEARLKGSGMHWARSHVDPMLALRNIVCNDRWDEAWPHIASGLRHRATIRRAAHHRKRHGAPQMASPTSSLLGPRAASESISPPEATAVSTPVIQPPKVPGPHRPAPNHPWRRSPIGRAQYLPAHPPEAAKV